jgi:uncharacterized protein YqgC (DUF456 family)
LSPFEVAGLTIFILVLFIGIFSIIFGFPGTVIILIDTVIYSLITGFKTIGWKIIAVLIILSLIAETFDFVLGSAGAKKFGSSKKGVVASVIGGIAGALLMTPFLLGLGAVIGAFLGGFTGTFLVELIEQKNLKPAFRAGYGTLIGRIAGIFAKSFFALVMIIIVLSKIYS